VAKGSSATVWPHAAAFIKSVYPWEGRVQTEVEWQLWIKTTDDQ
jgi:uncharacterized protein involved in tolerance to divalent cations